MNINLSFFWKKKCMIDIVKWYFSWKSIQTPYSKISNFTTSFITIKYWHVHFSSILSQMLKRTSNWLPFFSVYDNQNKYCSLPYEINVTINRQFACSHHARLQKCVFNAKIIPSNSRCCPLLNSRLRHVIIS